MLMASGKVAPASGRQRAVSAILGPIEGFMTKHGRGVLLGLVAAAGLSLFGGLGLGWALGLGAVGGVVADRTLPRKGDPESWVRFQKSHPASIKGGKR